jgi:hypothetical protein
LHTFNSTNPHIFWIGFRFQGSDISTQTAIALDDIEASCIDMTYDDDMNDTDTNDDSGDTDISDDDTLNDDYSNDDNDDSSDIDFDDDNINGSSDDDDSSNGCGCSMTSGNPDGSLFVIMLSIGLFALIWEKVRRIKE